MYPDFFDLRDLPTEPERLQPFNSRQRNSIEFWFSAGSQKQIWFIEELQYKFVLIIVNWSIVNWIRGA